MNQQQLEQVQFDRQDRRRERRLSDDGAYLTEIALINLRKSGREKHAMTLKTDFGDVPSEFYEVLILGEVQYADAVTGTLYDLDGVPIGSGPMRIEIPRTSAAASAFQ